MNDASDSIESTQTILRDVADDLRRAEERLRATVAAGAPAAKPQTLAADLCDGAEAVCDDLLRDAIETLDLLAGQTERDAADRRRAVAAAAGAMASLDDRFPASPNRDMCAG